MNDTKLCWHYTYEHAFYRIIESRVIKPATANIDRRQRPLTWFSTNQFWENTVFKGIQKIYGGPIIDLDRKQMQAMGWRLFRIGVLLETAPLDWYRIQKSSRMKTRIVKALAVTARELGADPKEWRGTFEPVPMSAWKAVQELVGDTWHTSPAEIDTVNKTVVGFRPDLSD